MPETVERALNRGYNVNCKDGEDNTPLICAVGRRFRDITQLLINHGAQLTSKNMEGTHLLSSQLVLGITR
jgi:ankyrin repeat protein